MKIFYFILASHTTLKIQPSWRIVETQVFGEHYHDLKNCKLFVWRAAIFFSHLSLITLLQTMIMKMWGKKRRREKSWLLKFSCKNPKISFDLLNFPNNFPPSYPSYPTWSFSFSFLSQNRRLTLTDNLSRSTIQFREYHFGMELHR